MAYGLTELCCCFYRFERQNEEKMHFIPHMLVYVGIFVNECAEELVADKIVLHFCMKFLAFSFSAGSAEQVSL